MASSLFVLGLMAGCILLLRWAWFALPQGEWQMVAALPVARRTAHSWQGLNLTYYGVWTATAVASAFAMFCILLGSLGVSVETAAVLGAILLAVCIPAAKGLAHVIEGKAYVFTVGGASFVGFLIAPTVIWGWGHPGAGGPGGPLPLLPTLAALAIAYAFGEGIGRLACISFGCCYGKPLTICSPVVRRLFGTRAFRFASPTQKAVYQAGLVGEPLVPIQGVTAGVCLGAGVLAIIFFLAGWFHAAFATAALVTQCWRVASEWLRADIPHQWMFSVYQTMAAINALYALALGAMLPAVESALPDIVLGLQGLWHPAVILLVEALWALVFLYTGRSMVTASTLSFDVVKDRI
ncbi:MAG: prolipoprotein diacylglyceryl transferase [Nitrospira sp.]|nr:MAG: prolipoprotein diacylglyceryl transferase [Nitrospira sp.]